MPPATRNSNGRGRRSKSNQTKMSSALIYGTYDNDLPFGVHNSLAFGNPEVEINFDDYMWCERICRVADAALREGYKISIAIDAGNAALVALLIGQRIGRKVVGRYDHSNERLVLWDMSPECEQ